MGGTHFDAVCFFLLRQRLHAFHEIGRILVFIMHDSHTLGEDGRACVGTVRFQRGGSRTVPTFEA